MKAIVIIVALQVITCQQARCQGGGGPSTFGYDASSACSKPYSRSGRARLANLPCDFRRQNWCTVAGTSYPWHAVRRFVQENQGLMRRMYGDERHINVLRAELEKNDVELKYDDYYHHYSDDRRRYEYQDDYEYLDEYHEYSKLNNHEHGGRGFTSRSFNDPTTKRLNKFVKLSEYTRPHFRPTDKSTSTISTTTTVTSMGTTTTSTSTSTKTVPSMTTSSTTTTASTTESPGKPVSSTTISSSTTDEKETNKTEETTTASAITLSQIVKEQNFSINEIPGQVDRVDENLEEVIEIAETNTEELVVDDTTTSSASTTEVGFDDDEESNWSKDTTLPDGFSSTEKQQQFRPRPENKISSKPEASTVGGQLYQDVAAKEQQELPVLKLRGVNACPVKEEVVAPFWANNTRGEVLALLNLYPFEQYVHWEKCTHENKQMYCRDGCRCEQQYRLHRLLAYDPNNECRGIFSDWFKFPSCCVCRCYDLPLEFRVTSRSPRAQKQRIKVRPPRSRFS